MELKITSAAYSSETQEAIDSDEAVGYASYDVEGTVDGVPFSGSLELELDGRDAFFDMEDEDDFEGEDPGQEIVGIACGVEADLAAFGPAAQTLFDLHQKARDFYLNAEESEDAEEE